MLKIDYHLPYLPSSTILEKINNIKETNQYSFATHQPDIDNIKKACEPMQKYNNIIIIGNGGSRNNTLAYIESLRDYRNQKNVYFLSTNEPDEIIYLKKKCSKEDTIIIPVSKSGTNVDALIPLTAFWDYPVLAVTGSQNSLLLEIAQQQNWAIYEHPAVGGRFTGRTSCAFVPLTLAGINIDEINNGCQSIYPDCQSLDVQTNPALKLAAYHYENDLKGFSEIFFSSYSQKLFGFYQIAVQLIHESTGKGGKGQTIFGDVAPENQHHTGQRFFGGRKNVIGWYLRVEEQDNPLEKISIPTELQNLKLRDGLFGVYQDKTYQETLQYDYQGNQTNALEFKIPHTTMVIDKVTPYSMGELMGFLQYYTVYSALLRDQDPFDQPQVERSKQVAFELAKK